MTSEKEELSAQLDSLREFQLKQKEFEADMVVLEAKLEQKEFDHMQEISDLDRKKAIEIDVLKKDMINKIKETRDNLRMRTKDQLDATTKRTIMENEQMSTELNFQSKETERLLAKNVELAATNKQMLRDLNIHRELEDELARRTHVYQKIIKKLHQKIKRNDLILFYN